jgi:hypothetical protein
MDRLIVLTLILFSPLAVAATSGSFDDIDDETPAPAVKPAPAKPEAPAVKSAPAKPAPVVNDEDEDDQEEVPTPVRRPMRKDDGLLSPARAAARQRSFNTDDEKESEASYKGCKNCSHPPQLAPRLPVHHITGPSDVLRSRIWSSFSKYFEECAPGCQPVGMGSYRDPHARPKPSCHHISAAIDVAGMRCGRTTYMAIRESTGRNAGQGRYSELVRCMHRKGMRTMYMEHNHYDHAHFSYGCVLPGGIRMIK